MLGLNGIWEISGGGAVLNALLVLENGPACMLKFPKKESGGGSIWDYAATSCIYRELGLPATNFAGERLDLNRKDGTFMNHQGVFFDNSRKVWTDAIDFFKNTGRKARRVDQAAQQLVVAIHRSLSFQPIIWPVKKVMHQTIIKT